MHTTAPLASNEEALATDALLALVTETIERLEMAKEKQLFTGTYAKLTKYVCDKMRVIISEVDEKSLVFMVDSSATNSLIRKDQIQAKLSGKTTHSVSASGQIVEEPFTKPLSVSWPLPYLSVSTTHSFLLSELCPVNLIGRDLMCARGITLSADESE